MGSKLWTGVRPFTGVHHIRLIFLSCRMDMDLEQPAVIRLVGEDAEVQNCPLVDHGIEADVRDALQVGRGVEKRVCAGQKRVRNWFRITFWVVLNRSAGPRG